MKQTKKRKRSTRKDKKNEEMLFDARNYKLIILGVSLIFIGFLAMYLDKKVFGFVTEYISPIVIIAGFAEIIYAIMKPKKKIEDNTTNLTTN